MVLKHLGFETNYTVCLKNCQIKIEKANQSEAETDVEHTSGRARQVVNVCEMNGETISGLRFNHFIFPISCAALGLSRNTDLLLKHWYINT